MLKSIDLDPGFEPKDKKVLSELLDNSTKLDSAFRTLAKQAGRHREITALWGRQQGHFGSACSQAVLDASGLKAFLSRYVANKDDFGLQFRGIVPNARQ